MAPLKLEYGPQPEELARRISQIDLSNTRRRSETITSTSSLPVNPRYTREYLMSLDPVTPNSLTVPPPTPNVLPHSPPADDQELLPTIAGALTPQPAATPSESAPSDTVDDDEVDDDAPIDNKPMDKTAADSILAGVSPVSVKKKKKKSKGGKGKNKKPAPTGFEGKDLNTSPLSRWHMVRHSGHGSNFPILTD